VTFNRGTRYPLLANLREYYGAVQSLEPIGYWPLWEPSGATAYDASGNGRNGTHANLTPGQAGMGDGRTSILYNGSNSLTDVFTPSLQSVFDGSQGTLGVIGRVLNAGVWVDGIRREATRFVNTVTFADYLYIAKHSVANQWRFAYSAGGVGRILDVASGGSLQWNFLLQTWDIPNDEFRAFVNGNQVGSTLDSLGVWAPPIGAATIGASGAGANVWSGWECHVFLLDYVLSPGNVLTLNQVAGTPRG
jgi:hypothetical protein